MVVSIKSLSALVWLVLLGIPQCLAIADNDLYGSPQYPLGQQSHEGDDAASFEQWLLQEEEFALDKLLQNIAPLGKNAKDILPGTVIASPSKEHPDYYYNWIRDAAITINTLVDIYSDQSNATLASTIEGILHDYATASRQLQLTSNPSGGYDRPSLDGLGEPKFNVDGTAFTGGWGRPQRDGPALRALTLMHWIKTYNASHPETWTERGSGHNPYSLFPSVYQGDSTIRADLDYVSVHWQHSGFDLWEEVNGQHFFTSMVQRKALKDAAGLARIFGFEDEVEWWAQKSKELDEYLPSFWDNDKQHLIATLDSKRSGLDCGVLLGSLHGTRIQDDMSFGAASDEVLVSLLHFVRDQEQRYPINGKTETDQKRHHLSGTGLGRYPEDGYTGYETLPDGGNPWFLCTASAAEVLYRATTIFRQQGLLNVTLRGLPFWAALLPAFSSQLHACIESNATCTISREDTLFETILARLTQVGEEFLAVIRRHANNDGSLSEQFNRDTGFEQGASDLTWSYGAFLQASRARKLARES